MSENWCVLITLLLFSICWNFINGFNLDTRNYYYKNGPVHSMFGFSVALHNETDANWIIVGAPLADGVSERFQPVYRGGIVYRCDTFSDRDCQAVPFDQKGDQRNDKGEQIDTKSGQWFGATVASAGNGGPIVACAPRYVFHTMNPSKVARIEPVGTCHLAMDNFRTYKEYSPCRTMYVGHHRQGSCQAGLSAAVSKDGQRVYIGAPGSYYWQGQMYSIHSASQFRYKPPRYEQFAEGQIHAVHAMDPNYKVYSTGESPAYADDSYLGYSSVSGDFVGDGRQGVAVGMPRGGVLQGKVVIYNWDLTNLKNITGEQIGGYFGYALCVSDIDGDGYDDLVVGAPMYTTNSSLKEGKYDVGRIYVFYQKDGFTNTHVRNGFNSRGRFGQALTGLGDINLDGYGDFAVGAPYDGAHGRGAVYIFHGSAKGVRKTASQVIHAEDFNVSPYPRTFGFSLSGGIDVDQNGYSDLAVGAYLSNNVFMLRARPVAVAYANVEFSAPKKLISLDEKNCDLPRSRQKVPCTLVRSCIVYNGTQVDDVINVDVSWVLDSKKDKNPRMFFVSDESKNIRNMTMRLYKNVVKCHTEEVYISNLVRDKLTALEIQMFYQSAKTHPGRERRSVLEAIIDQDHETVKTDTIHILKNCGPDNTCIPNLKLQTNALEKYLLGSNNRLVVDVVISNEGDDAFEAVFYMIVPHGLHFRKVDLIETIKDTTISCTPPTELNNNTLKCDIGNPFPANKVIKFKVFLIPSKFTNLTESYEIYMNVNSTNAERDGSDVDNKARQTIGIWIETEILVEGNAYPSNLVYYNSSQYKEIDEAKTEHDLGPQVVHWYNFRNKGPSTIDEFEVYILWPYKTKQGDELMYLLNQPETSLNMRCTGTDYANPRFLKLNQTLSTKSYLRSIASITKSTTWSGGFHHGNIYIDQPHHPDYPHHHHPKPTQRPLTEEERKRILDAEEKSEPKGDDSDNESKRAKDAALYPEYYDRIHWHSNGTGTYVDQYGRIVHVTSNDPRFTGNRGHGHGHGHGQGHGHVSGTGGFEGDIHYHINRTRYYIDEHGNKHVIATEESVHGPGGIHGGVHSHATQGLTLDQVGSGGTYFYKNNTEYYRDRNGQVYMVYRGAQTGSGGVGGAQGVSYHYQYGDHGGHGSTQDGRDILHAGFHVGGPTRTPLPSTTYDDEHWRTSHQGEVQGGSRVSTQGGGTVTQTNIRQEGYIGGSQGGAASSQTHTRAEGGYQGGSQGGYQTGGSSQSSQGGGSATQTYTRTEGGYQGGSQGGYQTGGSSQSSQGGGSATQTHTRTESGYQGEAQGSRAQGSTGGGSYHQESHSTGGGYQGGSQYSQGGGSSTSTHTRAEGGYQGGSGAQSQSGGSSYQESRSGGSYQGSRGGEGSHTYMRTGGHAQGVYGQQQGQAQAGSRTQGSHSQSGGGGGGYRRIEDIPMETIVNQDLSDADTDDLRPMISRQDGEEENVYRGSYGNQGFRTGTLDLETNGGGGRTQTNYGQGGYSSHSGTTAGHQGSSSSHSSSGGSYQYSQGGGSSSHSIQTRSGSLKNLDQPEYNDEYYDDYEDGEHETPKFTSHPSPKRQRVKRSEMKIDADLQRVLQCHATECAALRCTAGPIAMDEEVWIAIRTRVVAKTLDKMGGSNAVNMSTMGVARIIRLPSIGSPKEKPIKNLEVITTAVPEQDLTKTDVIPLWIVVLSACAGTVLLLLLIFIMYKLGFFKRNRPSDSSERQPLNRNNGYHGDEHL